MLEFIARHHSVTLKTDRPQNSESSGVKGLRYGLEGALVGVALVGMLNWANGNSTDNINHDVVGALAGFVSVIVARFFFLKNK
jgi:hypothetical protein